MIAYPPSLLAVGGARTGIAPVNLLDVLDVNGNGYFWSDRRCSAPTMLGLGTPAGITLPTAPTTNQGTAWVYPTTAVMSGTGGSGSCTVEGCTLRCEAGGPFSSGITATWGGFAAPALPAGAIVDEVYCVIYLEETAEVQGSCYLETNIAGIPNQGTFSGQYSEGIGTTMSAVTSASLYVQLLDTIDGTCEVEAEVTFIALVVYYTLAEGPGTGYPSSGINGQYEPWLLSVPSFSFHRSLQTDVGSFVLQNLSGDTLSRDFEKIMRRSALEGALFIWRLWQPDAQAAWLSVHGTLTVDDVGVDTVSLKGTQLLNPSQDDTPLEIYCETCQLQWGGPRCGSTETDECNYSYQSCQVPPHIMVTLNDYEKNYGEALANTAQQVINRARKF